MKRLLPRNLASKSGIYESTRFFTCRKAGTWDRFFHFPSEGRHVEDYSDTRKIQRLRPVSNPRTRVLEASMLTTRPPKPHQWCSILSAWSYERYWRLIRFRSVVLESSNCVCYSIVGTSLRDISGGGWVPVFGDICHSARIVLSS